MSVLTHLWHLTKSGGRPMAARVSHWHGLARRIVSMSESFADLSDEALLTRSQEVRWRAKLIGVTVRLEDSTVPI